MPSPVALIVLIACTARLTRIVVADTLLDSWRLKVFRRFPPKPTGRRGAHPIGQLASCDWCLGWWVALTVTVFACATGHVDWSALWITFPAVAWFAASAARWFDS